MLTVLVVEDDNRSFEHIKKALIHLGIGQIDYVQSAEDALSRLANHRYDLILLDIELPRMSGMELAKKMRQNPKDRLTKVIFITGSATDWELQAFRELHCYDYIRKPFTVKELEKKLDLLLEALEAEKGKVLQPVSPKTTGRTAVFFNQEGGEWFVLVDDVLYVEVIGGECLLHTKKGKLRLVGISFKEVLVTISAQSSDFVQCHRFFAVDVRQIRKILKRTYRTFEIYLNGVEKPIDMSAPYYEAVLLQWKGAER